LENPLLDVSALDVFYGGAQALHAVGFQLQNGEVFSIIGSNGSGKTTILKTLAGLIRPLSGQTTFDGTRIDGKNPVSIVDLGVSLVPEGRGLFLGMTVKENLELGAFPKRSRSMASESLAWVLGLFPILTPLQDQIAGKLSGGEQQMLAIARALMSRPRLLMLDEPSLGLAPLVVKTMFEIIAQLKAQGVTILLVEQNIHQALKIADRGCVIKTGRIAMTGRGCDLLTDPEIQKAYMGSLQ
jgi:branched-chain amino acid transport system ATP-binding protein